MSIELFAGLSIMAVLSLSFLVWYIQLAKQNQKIHQKNSSDIEELRKSHKEKHEKIDRDIDEIKKELDSIFKIKVVNN